MTLSRGVYPILVTPFDSSEQFLPDEMRRVVSWELGLGVQGVVCLGVAGEILRLSDSERREILQLVLDTVDGCVPVIVGVTATGTRLVEEHVRFACEAGASALLVAPPIVPGIRPDAILQYYQRIGAAASDDTIIVVQDEPNATGVRMTPELIAQIMTEIPQATAAKIEDPPTGRKIQRIRQLVDRTDELAFFGGLGGQYLIPELASGAAGAMTGFAFPEVISEMCQAYWNGRVDDARALFYRYLPLLTFEFQPLLGVGVRKESLRIRGVLSETAARHPGPVIDDATLSELHHLLEHLGLPHTVLGSEQTNG